MSIMAGNEYMPTREDLVEAIGHVNHEAKRQMCIVGTEAHPTPWDRMHRLVNEYLDELVGL